MSVVQTIMVDKLVDFIDALISKGKVKINGTYKNFDVFKTIKQDNTVRKYIYIETDVGYIEEAQLLSVNNDVLAIKPVAIDKQEDGLVIAFEFKLSVEEVSV